MGDNIHLLKLSDGNSAVLYVIICCLVYISFIYFFLFMATPVAYASSQASSRIGAVAAAYAAVTATPDPSYICDPVPQVVATQHP